MKPFPPELILDVLFRLRDAKLYAALATCALVSKNWLPFAREVLYRSRAVQLPLAEARWRSFLFALENPAIATLIKSLNTNYHIERGTSVIPTITNIEEQTRTIAIRCQNIKTLEITNGEWPGIVKVLSIPEVASEGIETLFLSFPRGVAPHHPFKKGIKMRPRHIAFRYVYAFGKDGWRFKKVSPYSLTSVVFTRCWTSHDQLRVLIGTSQNTLKSIILDAHREPDGYTSLIRALEPSVHCLRELSLLQCEFEDEHVGNRSFALQRLVSRLPFLEFLNIEGYVDVDSDFLDAAVSPTMKELRLVPFDWGLPRIIFAAPLQLATKAQSIWLYPPITVDVWIQYLDGPQSKCLEKLEIGTSAQWPAGGEERIKSFGRDICLTFLPPANRAVRFGSSSSPSNLIKPGCMLPRPCITDKALP